MASHVDQSDMFAAFAAPPAMFLPEPEEAPAPPLPAIAVKAVAEPDAPSTPRPLSPRPPQSKTPSRRSTGEGHMGPAIRTPAEGIIIAPRDVEFIVRPLEDLKDGHYLLAGTASMRAGVLCKVARIEEDTIETVVVGTHQDNRMRFCRDTGALLDASINRKRCDHETLHNMGIKIRATGPFIDKNAARDVPYVALMKAFQAMMPPLAPGSEPKLLEPCEPLPPPAMR